LLDKEGEWRDNIKSKTNKQICKYDGSHLKMGVEQISRTQYISYITQAMDNVQYQISAFSTDF
jgi:hypothetical protein